VVNDFLQVGWDFILEGNDFVPVGSYFFGGEKGHRQGFKLYNISKGMQSEKYKKWAGFLG
jgi:hypothetical protein